MTGVNQPGGVDEPMQVDADVALAQMPEENANQAAAGQQQQPAVTKMHLMV